MRKSGRRKSGRTRRTRRKRGGGCALVGADLQYNLAGSSASNQSLGQGGDFLQYHEGQHGGAYGNAVGSSIDADTTIDVPHGAAGLNRLDTSFAAIEGLKGGRRRRRTRRGLKHRRRHHTRIMGGKRKHRMKRRRSRGGALGYSPYPASGMLGVKAELHPDFKSGIELDSAMMRQAQ